MGLACYIVHFVGDMLSIPFRIPDDAKRKVWFKKEKVDFQFLSGFQKELPPNSYDISKFVFQFLSGFQPLIYLRVKRTVVVLTFNSFPDSRPSHLRPAKH